MKNKKRNKAITSILKKCMNPKPKVSKWSSKSKKGYSKKLRLMLHLSRYLGIREQTHANVDSSLRRAFVFFSL